MAGVRTRKTVDTADVVVCLYWNDRAKGWDLRAERVKSPGIGAVAMMRADASSEIDQGGLWTILVALRKELESWLPY